MKNIFLLLTLLLLTSCNSAYWRNLELQIEEQKEAKKRYKKEWEEERERSIRIDQKIRDDLKNGRDHQEAFEEYVREKKSTPRFWF